MNEEFKQTVSVSDFIQDLIDKLTEEQKQALLSGNAILKYQRVPSKHASNTSTNVVVYDIPRFIQTHKAQIMMLSRLVGIEYSITVKKIEEMDLKRVELETLLRILDISYLKSDSKKRLIEKLATSGIRYQYEAAIQRKAFGEPYLQQFSIPDIKVIYQKKFLEPFGLEYEVQP